VLLSLLACTPEPVAPVVPEPVTAPAPPALVAVYAGELTTCVRYEDERLVCFGKNALTALDLPGDIEVTDTEVCARTPGQRRCVVGGQQRVQRTGLVEMARGRGAACGRDADGQVFCFREEEEEGAKLVAVPLGGAAVRVVSGGLEACALLEDHSLWCWDPYVAMLREPEPHKLADGVLHVDFSYLQTCWATADEITCRGDGAPARVGPGKEPTALAVGLQHGCVLQGAVPWCWGQQAPDLRDAVSLAAGDLHTCALTSASDLVCWGVDRGQLRIP
jgi:hypothetical protein